MFLSSKSDERIIAEAFGFSKRLVEVVCNQPSTSYVGRQPLFVSVTTHVRHDSQMTEQYTHGRD
jgi:hypothetical protein